MSISRGRRRPVSFSSRSISGQSGSRALPLGSSCRSDTASYRGPTGLTDSEGSDDEFESPKFCFLAPSGYTGVLGTSSITPFQPYGVLARLSLNESLLADSESEEEGEEVQSAPVRALAVRIGVRVPTPPQRIANDKKAWAQQQLLVKLSLLSLLLHASLRLLQRTLLWSTIVPAHPAGYLLRATI